MVSRGLCGGCRDLAEIGLVGRLPPERLMRTPPIIPVEEFGKAALLFDAVGCRTLRVRHEINAQFGGWEFGEMV